VAQRTKLRDVLIISFSASSCFVEFQQKLNYSIHFLKLLFAKFSQFKLAKI
jgi:hypothetical protein